MENKPNNQHYKACGCQKDGLAIFPVRYAVIPKSLNKTLHLGLI